jgi:hypothetical protein
MLQNGIRALKAKLRLCRCHFPTYWLLRMLHLLKCGIFITLMIVDLAMSMVHGYGTIFGFFPIVFVKYLCGVSIP